MPRWGAACCAPTRNSISEGARSLQRRPQKRSTARTRTHRAGPALPSYLALHHAGFSVLPVLLPGRWALTPPFHPCLTDEQIEDVPQVYLRDATVLRRRRFIFCGTIRERISEHRLNSVPPRRSPDVIRRVALYPEPAVKRVKGFPVRPGRCPDFPPAHPSLALRRCSGQASDHPARPPCLV